MMRIFLVVPAFNEESRIKIRDWEAISFIDNVKVTFVDDGSTDATAKILGTMGKCDVISTSKNLGKAAAIKFGIDHIIREYSIDPYDWLGFLDADSAFEVEEIKRILNMASETRFREYAGIWASRVKMLGREIDRNELRHYVSRILITFLSFGMREFPYDSQAGFKLFRAKFFLNSIKTLKIRTRWFVDLEIWTHIKLNSDNEVLIWEEPVISWHEVKGSRIRLKHFPTITREVFLVKQLLRNLSDNALKRKE